MFELNEKYIKIDGSFVLSGPQAIVKLALLQKEIDERNGLNTAGYVSGYRGSPLGVVDKEFSSQNKLLTDKSNAFLYTRWPNKNIHESKWNRIVSKKPLITE